jgi:DNA-binding MarR family transcriptional regulator
MLKWLKRLALAVAPVGLLMKMIIDKRRKRTSPAGSKLLSYLDRHTSASVPELSSRTKFPIAETTRLLDELEQRGLVQLSGEQGMEHVRIAAITKAGREQVSAPASRVLT